MTIVDEVFGLSSTLVLQKNTLQVLGVLVLAFPVPVLSDSGSAVHTADASETGVSNVSLFETLTAEHDSFAFREDSFDYPPWPTSSEHMERELIPLPPPGPYMSTALNDDSIRGASFGQVMDESGSSDAGVPLGYDDMSMEMFSPDRPWPKDLRSGAEQERFSPQRWMPKGGYHFKPQSMPPAVHMTEGLDDAYQRALLWPYNSGRTSYEPTFNVYSSPMHGPGQNIMTSPQSARMQSGYKNYPSPMSMSIHRVAPYSNSYPQNPRP